MLFIWRSRKTVKKSFKLIEYAFNLYIFTNYIHRSNVDYKDEVGNEGYFDTEKVLRFIDSHFDEDFEEVLKYYKEKFSYRDYSDSESESESDSDND